MRLASVGVLLALVYVVSTASGVLALARVHYHSNDERFAWIALSLGLVGLSAWAAVESLRACSPPSVCQNARNARNMATFFLLANSFILFAYIFLAKIVFGLLIQGVLLGVISTPLYLASATPFLPPQTRPKVV